MNSNERSTALRVGVFVAIGVAVLAFGVILLGSKSGMFTSKTKLYVSFANINGLVPGAPVRLAGLDIGRVDNISFSDDVQQREARVELGVDTRYLPRLRADSVAFIDSKGLLGDKLINITIGSPDKAPLHEGDVVPTRPGMSLEELSNQVSKAVASVTKVTDRAGALLEALAEPQAVADLQRILHSTADLMEGIEKSDSVAHRLLYDSAYADEVGGILEQTRLGMTALKLALEHVQAITGEVQHGNGMVHALLYGKDGTKTLADLQGAAAELAALVRAVRTEPGLLHTLIYDADSGDMLKQWNEFSERINRISQGIEQGHGTVGGLLMDPSVYEDLKSLLGNIERNVVFKALIRYTIKQDELHRPALRPTATGATRDSN